MNSEDVTNTEKTGNGRCSDIYADEIKTNIKTLMRFREAWLRSSSAWSTDLFQYADPDFYFFRFIIDRQEKGTEPFMTRVLLRVMERYGISFEIPDNTFAFIIIDKGKRYGYRFIDFYHDQDVNAILRQNEVDKAFILRTWKPGRADEWISRENDQYVAEGHKLNAISITTLFEQYFGVAEYEDFLSAIDQYLKDGREITGYKSIQYFSTMNLATQKAYLEKILLDWQYKSYEFSIIDRTDKRVQTFLYFSPNLFPITELNTMHKNYISDTLYKAIIGNQEFAESFLTSEWLFHSLKELKHFDYTAVISGYLKSVEQLLYKIVMLNLDNNCKISMSSAKETLSKAKKNQITTYKKDFNTWRMIPVDGKDKYKYIDLTTTQVQYMDSSIGTFEFFIRNNPHILVYPERSKTIADMVSCFRTECRNGFFHTHNLSDWKIVETVRSNAIYLYFVLLGGCIIPNTKLSDLGFLSNDSFDELCKRIREFRHYNAEFIFEYTDGRNRNLIYDFLNNTIEYTDGGIEHYQNLVFYEVEGFCMEAYEKLDEGIRDDQIVYLRRDNLPTRILGVYRDGQTVEIPM